MGSIPITCSASCKKMQFIYARVAQLVERDLAKGEAAGSSPVSRSQRKNAVRHSFSLHIRPIIRSGPDETGKPVEEAF